MYNLPEDKKLDFKVTEAIRWTKVSTQREPGYHEYLKKRFDVDYIYEGYTYEGIRTLLGTFEYLYYLRIPERAHALDLIYNRPDELLKLEGIGKSTVSALKDFREEFYYTSDFYPFHYHTHNRRLTTFKAVGKDKIKPIALYVSSTYVKKGQHEIESSMDLYATRDMVYELMSQYEELKGKEKDLAKSYIKGALNQLLGG